MVEARRVVRGEGGAGRCVERFVVTLRSAPPAAPPARSSPHRHICDSRWRCRATQQPSSTPTRAWARRAEHANRVSPAFAVFPCVYIRPSCAQVHIHPSASRSSRHGFLPRNGGARAPRCAGANVSRTGRSGCSKRSSRRSCGLCGHRGRLNPRGRGCDR